MSRILSDNWSLQSIKELISNGFIGDESATIEIDKSKNEHKYKPIAYDVVRVEALMDFLNDIVLKDEIIVDNGFINAWAQSEHPLTALREAGVIQPFPFLAESERLRAPTESLVDRLCATSTLEAEQSENALKWAVEKSTPHPLLSSTLWGGAGMLARSHVYECTYTPHPLRKRLFINSGVFVEKMNASASLQNLVQQKRVQLFEGVSERNPLRTAFLNLPPIPLKIIEESSSLQNILQVAMEVRSELSELRQWLGHFQNAVDSEDIKGILEHGRLLDSVARHADQAISGNASGRLDMSVSFSILKLAWKGEPLNMIQNRFGVRATINSLIFDKPGKGALKKLIKFSGGEKTRTGFNVYEHFASEPV